MTFEEWWKENKKSRAYCTPPRKSDFQALWNARQAAIDYYKMAADTFDQELQEAQKEIDELKHFNIEQEEDIFDLKDALLAIKILNEVNGMRAIDDVINEALKDK